MIIYDLEEQKRTIRQQKFQDLKDEYLAPTVIIITSMVVTLGLSLVLISF